MTFLPTSSLRRVPAGARRRSLVAAGAALALAGSGVVAAYAVAPPPAHQDNTVGLKEVGPIDEANGFPLWYKDTNNVRLELCLDPSDTNCIMGDVPDPQSPVSFPDNFPDEAFWSAAEASLDAGGGEKALLVTAVEAAFGSADGLPADKQQISFGRIRVRAAGLVDDATYTVTHPYGKDTAVAEAGAVKGINVTEDVGSLVWDGVFDTTLGSRPGPFLKWDPNIAPAAPAGYLGDVTVGHEVVGSPYNTNVFRIEGPVGSFTGSADLCADATLGADDTATDDCIETDQFFVQGKIATRAGIQVTQASYRDTGNPGDKYIDLFAKSEAGQTLVVSGTGVSQTVMRATGGKYFARVKVSGAPPTDLAVTNTTDTPDTVDHVEPAQFGDKVHIESAIYDVDAKRITVKADSGDGGATLKLSEYPDVVATIGGSNNARTFTVNNVDAPPSEVVVTSNKGGFDTDDVIVNGNDLPSAQVVADLTATTTDIPVGQALNLDATASQGTVTSSTWTVTRNGDPVTGVLSPSGLLSRTFTPSADGVYEVTITVVGPGNGNTDTETLTIHVAAGATLPQANAGENQIGIVPTSVVTLNGSQSAFASTYQWSVFSGTGITLNSPSTANATFTVPASTTPSTWVLRLTVTNSAGTSTDDVTVTSNPDDLTGITATYKAGGAEWRVRGGAEHCSANNTVTVKWNKPGATPITLGSATPAADLGVCSWDFRLKNTPSGMRPSANSLGTVTVTSVLGGQVLNQTFQLL